MHAACVDLAVVASGLQHVLQGLLPLCTLTFKPCRGWSLAAGLVCCAASLALTAALLSSSQPSWLKYSSTAALTHTPAHTALEALLRHHQRRQQQEQQGRVCRRLLAQRKRSGGSRLRWHITFCGSRRERCRKCKRPILTVLNSCCMAGWLDLCV